MKTAILYLFIVSAFFFSCSSVKKTVTANAAGATEISANNDGSYFDKAIVIHEDRETPGIHAEYAWISNKYPGYKNRGQSLSYYKNKSYDIIHITTSDGKETNIYFDISNFYGKF